MVIVQIITTFTPEDNKYALLPMGACKYKGGQKINILTLIMTFYTDQRKINQSKKHVGLKRPISGLLPAVEVEKVRLFYKIFSL